MNPAEFAEARPDGRGHAGRMTVEDDNGFHGTAIAGSPELAAAMFNAELDRRGNTVIQPQLV